MENATSLGLSHGQGVGIMSASVYLDKGGHGIPNREENRGFTAVQGGVLVGCRRLTIATARPVICRMWLADRHPCFSMPAY